MLIHRPLMDKDLETITTFPKSQEELFYVSPRFSYPLTSVQISEMLKDRFEPTVVIDTDSDKVLGYANFYEHDIEKRLCWLGNVIIEPQHRGKGVANFLLNSMVVKAITIYGIRKLIISCNSQNSRGLAFYYKNEFKPIGLRIKNDDHHKFVTIQMERLL